eukprot:scpid77668/ scgid2796/ L-aminoadipate-semialdehyde dehydrogenase-phosphopantetheinyl transferase; 4&apos; Alpha-aminoadipic semialdehyde dehydrogenase-phosphopantetheinyl transferase
MIFGKVVRPSAMSLRWAFRYGSWNPTEEEWLKACASVQLEECHRVSQFCYKRDAKASLVGRLLLRKAVSSLLGIPYKEIIFNRTAAGKPFLMNSGVPAGFSVNISHQGSFTVLAAEIDRQVGIDTMDIARPANTSIQYFFRLMSSKFTESEWEYIRNGSSISPQTECALPNSPADCTEQEQLGRFYRMWCLKESFIKADGKGLQISLQRMSFTPVEPGLSPSENMLSVGTVLHFDGALSSSWQFHEGYLDDTHLVCVCIGPEVTAANPLSSSPTSSMTNCFTHFTVEQLLDSVEEIHPKDRKWWNEFEPREEVPRGQSAPT